MLCFIIDEMMRVCIGEDIEKKAVGLDFWFAIHIEHLIEKAYDKAN